MHSGIVALLGALLALLVVSQVIGGLFQRLHQPRVVGEILGGLLLSPTLFGLIAPGAQEALFAGSESNREILGFVFALGLLLLMFCSGLEIPTVASRVEARTALWLTGAGTLVPLAIGWVVAQAIDFRDFFGPQATSSSFGLILGMGLAVTSIPVISKIFIDLGLTGTGFSRVVLSAAMIEDMLLWVLLAITLGMAGQEQLGAMELGRAVLVTVGFFALCQLLGPPLYDRFAQARWNPFRTSAEAMPPLFVFLVVVLAGYLLGVNPIFGAFLAGRVVGDSKCISHETRRGLKAFSFGLFVPVYFAGVGLRLDLFRHFDVGWFLAILAFACLVKTSAAFVGARLSHQRRAQSLNLAVAMNARGGPGIVLATVALDARLIDPSFYAILVLLSLVTSQIAGWWLQHAMRTAPLSLDLSLPAPAVRTTRLPHVQPETA